MRFVRLPFSYAMGKRQSRPATSAFADNDQSGYEQATLTTTQTSDTDRFVQRSSPAEGKGTEGSLPYIINSYLDKVQL